MSLLGGEISLIFDISGVSQGPGHTEIKSDCTKVMFCPLRKGVGDIQPPGSDNPGQRWNGNEDPLALVVDGIEEAGDGEGKARTEKIDGIETIVILGLGDDTSQGRLIDPRRPQRQVDPLADVRLNPSCHDGSHTTLAHPAPGSAATRTTPLEEEVHSGIEDSHTKTMGRMGHKLSQNLRLGRQ